MKIAILSPIVWRTPPRNYGPWEQVASNIAEGLHEKGMDVTLFATGDSQTQAKLQSVCLEGYGENLEMDPKVWEALHISHLMEQADDFDIIHNHYDFLPLTYSKLINTPVLTTIHGFSSPKILEVYQKYNQHTHYVSISNSDRCATLSYLATVYHGINAKDFTFNPQDKNKESYLLYLGRIHPEKGTLDAIKIAQKTKHRLIIAGLIQDDNYFKDKIEPWINDDKVSYVGNVGPTERDKLLGEAHCLLHPIDFEEPFGLSVVESFFCGTPVIAFKRGSMPELIESGVNGFLVENINQAVDKIEAVINLDRAVVRQIAQERFSINRMVDDYCALYKKIL